MTAALAEMSPVRLAESLQAAGRRRIAVVRGETDAGGPAGKLVRGLPGFADHEAVFLETGRETGVLFGAFLHRTLRGQAQGGVRYWTYPTLGGFLDDGLRLAVGMGRKSALAGLWWGGGKGVIARPPRDSGPEPGRDESDARRRAIFAEYGRFVTSLRGCYVTAEDAGTTSRDMEEIYRNTRYTTCIPPELGGSGNPSQMTAAGVVVAMEAALAFREMGTLRGKHVAMQGAGNVGAAMIEELLARDARVTVAEVSADACDALRDRFAGRAVEIRCVDAADESILCEPCDVLALNALGGALYPDTIRLVRASVICGAANNQLVDEERDARLLAARGITYVPDFVANRMGIVSCANEHAGCLPRDPAVLRHLDPDWPGSIGRVTTEILATAAREGATGVAAANALADERSLLPHPIWGHRGFEIALSLIRSGWEQG